MNQGTEERRDSSDILESLRRLKSEVFYDENEQLALGLGRTTEEVEAWLSGTEEIDEDGEMKIRRGAFCIERRPKNVSPESAFRCRRHHDCCSAPRRIDL